VDVLEKGLLLKMILAQGHMEHPLSLTPPPLGLLMIFPHRAARFDAGDVLGNGRVRLIGPCYMPRDGYIAHALEVIGSEIGRAATPVS